MKTNILLVEDDERARESLADVLHGAGYVVTLAPDGETAVRMIAEHEYAIVVSDIRMRGIDGIQVLHAARARERAPVVILLTGYGSVETAIAALRAGAFDYLLKPCAPPDLLACVGRAAAQRAENLQRYDALQTIAEGIARLHGAASDAAEHGYVSPETISERFYAVGDLTLDVFRHTAVFAAQPLHLTPIEFTLLRCLAEAEGRVLDYRTIVHHTHDYDMDEAEAQLLLKAHVRNLRRKIPADYIVNVRGTGYMLVAPDSQPGSVTSDE